MYFFGLVVGILAIVLAALVLIFGFKLFKIFLPILGLVVGLFIGAGGVTLVLGDGLFATVLSWIVAIIVGIIFGLLAYFLFTIYIVLLGASIGAGLFAWVFLALGFNEGFIVTLMAIAGAVIFGILAVVLRLQKYIVIILTSFAGASTGILGLMLVFNQIQLDHLPSGEALNYLIANSLLWMIIWFAAAIFGIVFQSLINAGNELDPKEIKGGF